MSVTINPGESAWRKVRTAETSPPARSVCISNLSAIVVVMVRRPPHVVTALITCEPSEADRVVSRWARIVELTAKQGEHWRGDGILLGSELEF